MRIPISLDELNTAIREVVTDLNAKIMRKLGVSRDELFAEIGKSALKALPSTPYQYAEWKKSRSRPTTTSRSPVTTTRCAPSS